MVLKRTQKIFLRSSMQYMIFSISYQLLQSLLSIHIQMISIGCYLRQITVKAGDIAVPGQCPGGIIAKRHMNCTCITGCIGALCSPSSGAVIPFYSEQHSIRIFHGKRCILKVNLAVCIGDIEEISLFSRDTAIYRRKACSSGLCITRHALINHNTVNIFTGVSIIGIVHTGYQITVL